MIQPSSPSTATFYQVWADWLWVVLAIQTACRHDLVILHNPNPKTIAHVTNGVDISEPH